jgi:beta-glucosidase
MSMRRERPVDFATLNEANLGKRLASPEVAERVEALLSRMTLADKIGQMHGVSVQPIDELYWTRDNLALGIPALRMVDGPRGARVGIATTFPVAMARGATFDIELEWRVGRAIAREAKARGANVLLAPAINLLRHPAWGRAQETYGEDPLHVGQMGMAFIAGAQTELVASVKHFALNSIEDTRFEVDVSVDERTLHEVYLPHFRACVQRAHVGSVMSAYNKVNGRYCAENARLLRDILKNGWGFLGFVESDWIFGTRSTLASIEAGLDIEMPHANFYGPRLRGAVERKQVSLSLIDDAVRRILRVKFAFKMDEPTAHDPQLAECHEHQELALEVAHKSIVLLKNDQNVLPLRAAARERIAVVGRLANAENTGDRASSAVRSSFVSSVLSGIRDHIEEDLIEHVPGDILDEPTRSRIRGCQAAIVVVGLDYLDEGENIPFMEGGGDRDSLRLSARHEALVREVASVVPRTIVLLQGGSAIEVSGLAELVPALLMLWYPGMLGGEAAADILFGKVSPSGRLPITFARDSASLPPFDHDSKAVTYHALHGYRLLAEQGRAAHFPFGFGLSYTHFEYQALTLETTALRASSELRFDVQLQNAGQRFGEEVIQAYVSLPADALSVRAIKKLAAFARVKLLPGETKIVELTLAASELVRYDTRRKAFVVDPGAYQLWVGPSSEDLPLRAEFHVTASE